LGISCSRAPTTSHATGASGSGEIGQVVEGVLAARAVRNVAGSHQVEMPIAEQICRVIYEGLPPREAVSALMGRAVRSETE